YLNADRERQRAEVAETNWKSAAEEAQRKETKAREAETETKAVLDFFQKRVLSATRPKNQEGGLGRQVTVRQAVDYAEPNIAKAFAGHPLAEASIRQAMGITYFLCGDYDQAIQQHERALALRQAQLGQEHPDTMSSMQGLAQEYLGANRLTDALRLHEQVFKLRLAKLG